MPVWVLCSKVSGTALATLLRVSGGDGSVVQTDAETKSGVHDAERWQSLTQVKIIPRKLRGDICGQSSTAATRQGHKSLSEEARHKKVSKLEYERMKEVQRHCGKMRYSLIDGESLRFEGRTRRDCDV